MAMKKATVNAQKETSSSYNPADFISRDEDRQKEEDEIRKEGRTCYMAKWSEFAPPTLKEMRRLGLLKISDDMARVVTAPRSKVEGDNKLLVFRAQTLEELRRFFVAQLRAIGAVEGPIVMHYLEEPDWRQ